METLERLATARQILVRAESSVGLKRAYPPTRGAHVLSDAQSVVHGETSSESAPQERDSERADGLAGGSLTGGYGMGGTWSTQTGWSVPSFLTTVLPRGLLHGMTLGVRGSRLSSLLMAGLASSQGAWVACIGIPDMSWGMAALLGMNFERVILVPDHKSRVLPQVISTAIDGFDVVLVGQQVLLDPREKRLLSRRALSRKILLIAEGWEGREQVHGRLAGVEGLRNGSGHILSLNLDVFRPGGKPCRIAITQQGWGPRQGIRAVPPIGSEASLGRPAHTGEGEGTEGRLVSVRPTLKAVAP